MRQLRSYRIYDEVIHVLVNAVSGNAGCDNVCHFQRERFPWSVQNVQFHVLKPLHVEGAPAAGEGICVALIVPTIMTAYNQNAASLPARHAEVLVVNG